jgi:hypothetical protein
MTLVAHSHPHPCKIGQKSGPSSAPLVCTGYQVIFNSEAYPALWDTEANAWRFSLGHALEWLAVPPALEVVPKWESQLSLDRQAAVWAAEQQPTPYWL